MRELVEQIDAHLELDNMEATRIPCAGDQPSGGSLTPIAGQQQIESNRSDDSIARPYLCCLHLCFLFYIFYFIQLAYLCHQVVVTEQLFSLPGATHIWSPSLVTKHWFLLHL